MTRYFKAHREETETHALARRLVERSGLDEKEANQAVDDYLHAEGGSLSNPEPTTSSGKVDFTRAH